MLGVSSGEREAYVQAVEQAWVAFLGRGLFLSAKDVALVERWHADGIPLDVAVEGLRAALGDRDDLAGRRGRPTALSYYRHGVEAAIARVGSLGAVVSPAPVAISDAPGLADERDPEARLDAAWADLEPEEAARLEAEVLTRLRAEPAMGARGRELRRRALMREVLGRDHGLRWDA